MASITEILSVAHSDAFPGRIDLPVAGDQVYGDLIEVRGTIAHGWPVEALEVIVGGTVVRRAPMSVTSGESGGFVLTLDARREMTYELGLRAVHADGSRHPFGTIECRHRVRGQPTDAPRVSIAIPCHNQSRFIAEAISSVLDQSYRNFEVVVIDDGSLDDSAEIAEGLGIRCVRQARSGPSEARNAGFRATTGDFVVFLDGDNRLHPYALEANLHSFEDQPQSAFVGGRYGYIDELGAPYAGKIPEPMTHDEDHYAALLAGNYFGSPDNVMFRRAVLDAVGLFDRSVDGLEDYDLYLRIAKDRPVYHHRVAISQYRLHGSQFSHDQAMMLRSAVRVLHRHRRHARSDPALRAAYREGLAHWRGAYGRSLGNQLRTAFRTRRWSETVELTLCLLRWHPRELVTVAKRTRQAPVASR